MYQCFPRIGKSLLLHVCSDFMLFRELSYIQPSGHLPATPTTETLKQGVKTSSKVTKETRKRLQMTSLWCLYY